MILGGIGWRFRRMASYGVSPCVTNENADFRADPEGILSVVIRWAYVGILIAFSLTSA